MDTRLLNEGRDMRCPKCACLDDKVIDTRASKDGDAIRRRRECLGCAHRFTTHESVTPVEVVVVKRDGTRQDFDPEKLRLGIHHACWKRQIAESEIDRLVADVAARLTRQVEREVSSQEVGEIVMEELQKVDEVAYVRFASVYRSFKDVDQFINEVQSLTGMHASDRSELAGAAGNRPPMRTRKVHERTVKL